MIPVSSSTRRTEPSAGIARRNATSSVTARSYARTRALTPEVSQKIVEVMSAITRDTPGVRAAVSLATTWSQLVTSISAGRTTMTGVVSATCSPILQANTAGSHRKTKTTPATCRIARQASADARGDEPSDPPAQSQDDDDDDHDKHYRAESDIHIRSSL